MQRANERRLGDSMAGAISPDKGQAPFRRVEMNVGGLRLGFSGVILRKCSFL